MRLLVVIAIFILLAALARAQFPIKPACAQRCADQSCGFLSDEPDSERVCVCFVRDKEVDGCIQKTCSSADQKKASQSLQSLCKEE
ncbi:uncharacterized protein SCHCODRAFT_01256658 [Schizophyllum commune H4-8]|uniref:uncharacterized protein n=1 Tax=Schizophyllum commune (strain H4-8 / FGSC 9210) TaxID=578458 RepID=UPI0021605150|nr:uncharacterized protein SCHCODRAFT_01256658 [Schizophyllum commune H4-8]KAI5885558.1 hypothetical protein SCHCODRAFT_01256658 [Schizophyllum commune H4-8]